MISLSTTLAIITLVVLIIASYTDIRTREVPDWLSYSLIGAAFGIRVIFSFSEGWFVLLSGVLGFIIFLGLAYLFYYTDQWGGADSKLLMGMGAVIGISWPLSSESVTLLWFFLALLFGGALYGLTWMVVVAFRNGKIVREYLDKNHPKYVVFLYSIVGGMIVTYFLGVYFSIFWWTLFFPLVAAVLIPLVSIVEKTCFVKRINVKDLTEGDWLSQDVVAGNEVVMSKRTLERVDINLLARRKIKSVMVKEGVPFVPSFLIAYAVVVFVPSTITTIFGSVF